MRKRTMMNAVMKRKLIGPALRHNQFIILVAMGEKIKGKRIIERRHKSFFEKIFRRMGFNSYQQLYSIEDGK